MSLSFRKLPWLLGAAVAPALPAADWYFVPQVDAGVEYNTDRDMTPDGATPLFKGDVVGYTANIGGVLGARSPTGQTELRPRVLLEEFPDRNDLEAVNGYLDLRSQYRTQLSRWTLTGRWRREDRTRAEFVSAGYDEFNPNPNDPVADSAGRVSVLKQTVTDAQLNPEFRHSLTQRFGFGIGALYQQASFSSDDASFSGGNYKSGQLDAFLTWDLQQRTYLTSGVYAARFKTDDDNNTTRGYGVSADLSHDFSERMSGTLSMDVERTEVEQGAGPVDESNNFGLNVSLVKTGEIDEWRFNAGRSISPSLYGYRANVDQIRVQYLRNLTPRLRSSVAVRGLRNKAQGENISGRDDRDYARAEFGMRYEITRTWYVDGGYSYTRQKYASDPGSGDNHTFSVRFGYQGLPPRPR